MDNIEKREMIDRLLDIYCEVYNLFESNTIEDIYAFFKHKRRTDILSMRRKRLIILVKMAIDKLAGKDTMLIEDDLPIGRMTKARARRAVD